MKKHFIKKTMSILIMFLFLISFVNSIDRDSIKDIVPAIDTNKDNAQMFDTYQQKLLNLCSKSIDKLDKLNQKIQDNPNLDESEKKESEETINTIETQIKAYQTEINQATTVQELNQINKELVAYLKENKETIRKTTAKIIFNIIEYSIPILEEYINKIESDILPVLKKTCSDQAMQIDALEKQLDELKELLDLLENYAENFDPEEGVTKNVLIENKNNLIKAVVLAKSIAMTVQNLQSCM